MMYEAKNSTRDNVAVAGLGLVMDKPLPLEPRREIRLAEIKRATGS